MLAQGSFQRQAVTNVAFHQCQRFPGNFFDTPYRLWKAVAKIFKNDDLVACLEQLHARMRTNITCTACDEDVHLNSDMMCIAANYVRFW
jgi:hypothetical protein